MVSELTLGIPERPRASWHGRQVGAALQRLAPQCAVRTVMLADAGAADLLAGRVDALVWQLADLTPQVPEGVCIAAVLKRRDPAIVLVARPRRTIATLPRYAQVGSADRLAILQLQELRPDIVPLSLPDDLDDSLARVASGEVDAGLFAMCALETLAQLPSGFEPITTDLIIPAPGQGVRVLACRADDACVRDLLAGIDHRATRTALRAERSFVCAVDASAGLVSACYARAAGGSVLMSAMLARADGKYLSRAVLEAYPQQAAGLGPRLVAQLRASMDAVRNATTERRHV